MGCGRDDKLVKSCARGDKNNRASDYGQKSAFFSSLFFLFVPFPLVILSHWNKNISTMAAKTSQAAVEIRFLLHEEESVPRRLNWIHLSLSLSSLIFMGSWFLRGGGRAEEGERRAVGREEGGEGNGGREAGGDLMQLQAICSY